VLGSRLPEMPADGKNVKEAVAEKVAWMRKVDKVTNILEIAQIRCFGNARSVVDGQVKDCRQNTK